MMNSFNCTGRLVDDPKYFEKNGVARVVFTLAVDRDGAWKQDRVNADFLDFVAWHETADYIWKNFRKGDLMQVSNARAKVLEFTDGEGKKRRKTEYDVDRVYKLYRRKKVDESSSSEEIDS